MALEVRILFIAHGRICYNGNLVNKAVACSGAERTEASTLFMAKTLTGPDMDRRTSCRFVSSAGALVSIGIAAGLGPGGDGI